MEFQFLTDIARNRNNVMFHIVTLPCFTSDQKGPATHDFTFVSTLKQKISFLKEDNSF